MDTSGWELTFDEQFTSGGIDPRRWLPYYLPHWSTWDQAAARYEVRDEQLHLLIEADQAPWCPELDGPLRVSSLQTGLWAGGPGSQHGQHQFSPPATVRNGPHDISLYAPCFGRFEVQMRASADPRLMVAFWMLGPGDAATRSAEICVSEIFGRDVDRSGAAIGVGVHPHQDPAVVDDFERIRLPIDVTEPHEYAVEWTPERLAFFVDGEQVKVVHQAIATPMHLFLGVYEFPPEPGSEADGGEYPKRFVVDWVRGYAYRP